MTNRSRMRSFLIVTALGLTACSASNTEADFLCSAQVGTPCTTMSQADSGHFSSRAIPVKESISDNLSSAISQASLRATKTKGSKLTNQVPQGMPNGGAPYTSTNYRVPEQLGTVWIAPYLDQGGLLHEATYVHFVVQEAQWGNRGG